MAIYVHPINTVTIHDLHIDISFFNEKYNYIPTPLKYQTI